MANDLPSLEPLADYLRPRFGNIYDVNFEGIEVQPWTTELREAVKCYLVHEVSDDDYAALLNELESDVPAGSRTEQAEFIITHHQAWEIAHAFHRAVVKTISALDQLIGDDERWVNADAQEDVADWLDAHASDEQLQEMAEITDHPELDARMPRYTPELTGWHLAWNLTPARLLDAWHQVAEPPSTRTDGAPPLSQRRPWMPSAGEVRSWARAHGYWIGERGRIPMRIARLYHQMRGEV